MAVGAGLIVENGLFECRLALVGRYGNVLLGPVYSLIKCGRGAVSGCSATRMSNAWDYLLVGFAENLFVAYPVSSVIESCGVWSI